MRRPTLLVLLVGLAALLVMLPSCLLSTDEEVACGGITLRIDPAPRGISVSEYQVYELRIEVYDPGWYRMDEIWWQVGDPPVEHTIYAFEEGEYTVMVTHFGDRDGEQFEATEGVMVPISAGVITRVVVTPGMIGAIETGDPGPPEPCEFPVYELPDCPEVYGTWVGEVDFSGAGGGPSLLWVEITFNPDGTAENLVYESELDTVWLEDMSMRGIYTGADGYLEGTWTHMWYYDQWNEDCPGVNWTADYLGIGDPWILPVDFDGDGYPDIEWELYPAP